MTAFLSITVDPDGTLARHEWDVNDHNLLPMLQRTVGGYVDVVGLAADLDMWVNDEGLFTEPVNPAATRVAAAYAATAGRQLLQQFHGTVVFTGGSDRDGRSRPLPARRAAQITAIVNRACGA